MNKIFSHVARRATVNAVLFAASCLAQAQPEQPGAAPEIHTAAQRGESASVRRLVHLHYAQTGLLAQGADLSRSATGWPGGLDQQPHLDAGLARGTPVFVGRSTAADGTN